MSKEVLPGRLILRKSCLSSVEPHNSKLPFVIECAQSDEELVCLQGLTENGDTGVGERKTLSSSIING